MAVVGIVPGKAQAELGETSPIEGGVSERVGVDFYGQAIPSTSL
jgi:hypothetical protein